MDLGISFSILTNLEPGTDTACDPGVVFHAPDDIDWDDEVRLALEERRSFSPDALTGMESNLRFAGPETMETKIFLIFQKPILFLYGGVTLRIQRQDPTPALVGA